MKMFRVAVWLLGVSLVAGHWGTVQVLAKPVKSRSVKAAARLKNHPPAGWINHYLGDDRYKIAGHVWKVVSTQSDQYFHRPDCPEMLHQSADIVIGFPSVASALEAGYMPDPHCRPDINTAAVDGRVASTRAQQVRLSDGRSTVTLPAGWRQLQSQNIHSSFLNATIDSFQSGSSSRDGAAIITIDFPKGGNNTPLTAAKAREYMTMYQNSGYVNSAIPGGSQDVNVRDVTFKGMKGVLMTPKTKSHGDSLIYMVQKGSRLYVVVAGGQKSVSAGARSVINSYNPR